MDQKSMKQEYELLHSSEAARIKNELQQKFTLIIRGAKPSEIGELINARTGEKLYVISNEKKGTV